MTLVSFCGGVHTTLRGCVSTTLRGGVHATSGGGTDTTSGATCGFVAAEREIGLKSGGKSVPADLNFGPRLRPREGQGRGRPGGEVGVRDEDSTSLRAAVHGRCTESGMVGPARTTMPPHPGRTPVGSGTARKEAPAGGSERGPRRGRAIDQVVRRNGDSPQALPVPLAGGRQVFVLRPLCTTADAAESVLGFRRAGARRVVPADTGAGGRFRAVHHRHRRHPRDVLRLLGAAVPRSVQRCQPQPV